MLPLQTAAALSRWWHEISCVIISIGWTNKTKNTILHIHSKKWLRMLEFGPREDTNTRRKYTADRLNSFSFSWSRATRCTYLTRYLGIWIWGQTQRSVPASRAVVATGALGQIETRHVCDAWKCGSLCFIFTHPPEDKKNNTSQHNKTGTATQHIKTQHNTTNQQQQQQH